MISEKQVAAGFSSLWREALPLLSPHAVRLFREAYGKAITDKNGDCGCAVEIDADNTQPAIVAECAFHAVRIAMERELSIAEASNTDSVMREAENAAWSFTDAEPENREALNVEELKEVTLLMENYRIFLDGNDATCVDFSPQIPGCGFVSACRADLSIDDTLYEIKTVNRNIAGKDIRQLLTYLALQSATGVRRWPKAGFFNPRLATVYTFGVDGFLQQVSGGNVSSEVFEQMIDYFSSREIQIDTAF